MFLLGCVVACGQTEFEPGASGGTPGTGGASASSGGAPSAGAPTGGAGGSFGGGLPVPKAECIVAVHADQCCTPPVPVTAAAMAADPCLVPYGLEFLPATMAACPAVERCLAYDCGFSRPPSRIAAPDPASENGCRFANECATEADCIVATDVRGCCGCPAVFPKDLTLVNPCISPPGPPAGVVCNNNCSGVVCGPCPSPPPQVVCSQGVDYLTCADMIHL